MDGTWRVNTTADDDYIGFVFGYQNSEHFYLFDWKKADQNDPLGFAERGMSVKVVNASSTLTGSDFWPTNGNGTRVRSLFHNTVPWVSFTDYQFTLQFRNGEIKIVVKQGTTVLADITVNDSTYTNGLFGFYNYSQEQVRYSGFRRLSLAQGTYTYDVEATDPDGDAITYSLTTAPPNMTINATTGLISWPVTSRDAGDHTVAIRAQDVHGAFDTQSYTLTILNQNQAPIVSAGADQTIAVNGSATLNGTVTDDGLPRNAAVTSTWSMVSGPGLVAFADASSPATTATFSEAGTYVLRLTATDTALTASDEVIVTVTPPNRAPEVNAGPDLTITLPGTARLNGSVTDDGLPLGSTLTVTWSQVSGPGTATFANAAAAVTTATFSEAGTYVLRLSASDSHLTGADDVTVTVNAPAPNQAPVVEAGANASIDLNANRVQNGGNDEQLVNGEIRGWTEAVGTSWTLGLSGASGFPESVNGGQFFYAGDAGSAELRQDIDVSAFAATIAAGTQSFEWKTYVRSRAESTPDSARVILEYRNAANTTMIARLDSGEVTSTSAWQLLADTRPAPAGTGWIRLRLIATRRTGTTNDAYFDAISFRPVTGAGLKLNGIVTDDGLPAGAALTVTWSTVSGPGTVTFADANSASTSATFAAAGTYILRLTANDSELTSSDELTVTVEPANLAPVVNAGADQTITLPATASLSGSVSDDGKPVGATVTSKWTKISGPGTVTFADATALNTTAAFSVAGTYVLQLTADDTEYTATDTITIVVNPVPPNTAPTVNAGADQVIQPPATSAVLTGIVNDDGQPPGSSLTYLWTKISGPGNVSFSSPTALTTTATFSEAGVYILRLTASDSELSGTDDVRVTLNGTNKAPTVNAGADQTVAHPTTINLVGTANDDGLPIDSSLSFSWTKISGPGTVTFSSGSALQTAAAFSAAGTYVLRLTASDSALSGSDDVTITQTAPPTVSITSPADGATIAARTSVVGTVNEASSWRVEYSLNEEGVAPTWTTLATGTTPVINGSLASFDPTVLLNGVYTIRLVATNAANQTSTVSLAVMVEGEQKVGNFSLGFTDLSIPMAGMPIEVTRTYDSRDKRLGDFGIGWTLGVRNVRLQESGNVGSDWQGTVGGGFFPSYCAQASRPHVVTVTLPNGRVFKFEAVITPQCSTLFPLRETTISYRAMTGTNATLTPVGDPTVFIASAFPGPVELLDYGTFDPVDFDEYRLTLPSGEVMLISQQSGLKQWNDASGNTLTITSNGIIHSSGKSVVFVRDSLGRITQITDPLGNAMVYSYDANGDLVSFRDRENQTSTFSYNSSHGLLSMLDPRGKQPVRIEYDDQGRVVRQIDANGKIINFSHDTNNRREVTTDRLGNSTVMDYNARGMVVRITDSDGNITTRTYDSRDNLISETNAAGKTTGFSYDARNNKLSETDALGNITRFTYNARDQVLTKTDALGRITTNEYDAAGNLLSTKDPLNQITTYTYTAKGQIATKTDPLNNITRFEYDASGNLTKETDPLGNVTISTYDANNNKLTQSVNWTNAAGVVEALVTTYEYDRLGRLVKTIAPDGSFTEAVYDGSGRQIATRDQLGRQTNYDFDDLGQPIRVTFPDGTKQESTYDAEGRVLTTTDRGGRVTTNVYDALGRLLKTTYPGGAFITKTYDSLGRVTSQKDEKGNTTTFEYDPNCGCSNRRTKVIDALNNATVYTFDGVGNTQTMTDAKGNITRYEYDGNNRRTRTIHPDTTVETATYDANGLMATKTDQAGRVTRFDYDKLGRLIKVTDALQHVTSYTYNEVGNMLTQVDANNRTTRFEYDRLGRRVKRTLPLGMSETFVYNAVGNVTSRTNFKGETTTYTYDSMNQLLRKTPAAALNQPEVVFTYHPTGNRASMTDATGTTTYTYDLRDRLTSKVTPNGTLTYTYDAVGNLASMTSSNAGGVSVTYTTDVLNRLASVTDNHQTATTNYNYDANGNLASFTTPNGVQSTFTYNTLNRLTNISVAKGVPLASYTYQLGPAGNRLSVAELGGRQVGYTYDVLYRLTQENVSGDSNATSNGVIDYTYDAVGNRLTRTSTMAAIPSTTSTYDANDRLTGETYDADGNQRTSGGVTYNYDFEDRLSDVNNGAVSFAYDGDGNRVAKTVGGVTTKYLVDTLNPTTYAQVVEEIVGGSVQRVYNFGHDLISQRQLIGGNWTTSYFGYDGTGSVRFLTDANGTVTDTYTYDAFGTLVASTGSTPNEYLFTGERFDPNVGFYYLRARYMNPATGRFLTRDTHEGIVFEPATLHKYLYVANNPVNRIDPSGLLLAEMLVAEGTRERLRTEDAAQKIAMGNWIRWLLVAIGIGVIAISITEIERRKNRPIRLHHYTDWVGFGFISKVGGTGVNSPSGVNFWSPNPYIDADTAENRLAVCKKLEVRITLDVYVIGDGFYWPPTLVAGKTCPPGSNGGWAGKFAEGKGLETTTSQAIPYHSRNPMIVPLF
jgi:RHS repeat-associated protein